MKQHRINNNENIIFSLYKVYEYSWVFSYNIDYNWNN